jgi:L-arabinonolactonase
MGSAARLREIHEVQNSLGECPLWNDRDGHFWWTDLHASLLCRLDPASGAISSTVMPERLCSFAFLARRDTHILAAFETGLAFYDLRDGGIDWITRPEHGPTGMRFNDGRVDRQGRFWVGTMMEERERIPAGSAALYCLTADRLLTLHAEGVTISNGLCTSPDGTTLYFADSPRRIIHAFDLDTRLGTIDRKRVFATVRQGVPDGSAVDCEGHVWSARWGAGTLVRHAPDGRAVDEIALPVSQPTCVAFGGADMKLLFVTSAREGMDQAALEAEKLAGAVLIYESDVAGLTEERFRERC